MSSKIIANAPSTYFRSSRSHPHRSSIPVLKCAASAADDSNTTSRHKLITLTIKKPLGLVLAENSKGQVFVENIAPAGNADRTKQVQIGDIVVKTSATVLKSSDKSGQYEREGYGQRVYDNWETIDFDCTGQSFDTVMAAIASNNERWGIKNVTLTLQREEDNVDREQLPFSSF